MTTPNRAIQQRQRLKRSNVPRMKRARHQSPNRPGWRTRYTNNGSRQTDRPYYRRRRRPRGNYRLVRQKHSRRHGKHNDNNRSSQYTRRSNNGNNVPSSRNHSRTSEIPRNLKRPRTDLPSSLRRRSRRRRFPRRQRQHDLLDNLSFRRRLKQRGFQRMSYPTSRRTQRRSARMRQSVFRRPRGKYGVNHSYVIVRTFGIFTRRNKRSRH